MLGGSRFCKWVAVWPAFLIVFLMSCQKGLFQGPPKITGSKGEKIGSAEQIVITTHSIARASSQQKGQGELRVTSWSSLKVSCPNCPAPLPLKFEERPNATSKAFLYIAPFQHDMVQETQLCKISLKFDHPNGVSENQNYGVYFCPVDSSKDQAVCDKAKAKVICG